MVKFLEVLFLGLVQHAWTFTLEWPLIETVDKLDCKSNFNYDTHDPSYGPPSWWNIEQCYNKCAGKRQSPVNIITSRTKYSPSLQLNMLIDPNKRVPGIIYNNGHCPQFEGLQEQIWITFGGREQKKFVFEKIHLHIGASNTSGSEHSIDGQFAPLEAHMIFFNAMYGTYDIAQKQSDGLIVIAVHVYVGTPYDAVYSQIRPRCSVRYATQLSSILENNIPRIRHYSDNKPLFFVQDGISPLDAMPMSKNYYIYKGSLTTPPCYESVTWIVMDCPIMISPNAYAILQSVEDDEGHCLRDYGNRRPIQRSIHHGVERNFS